MAFITSDFLKETSTTTGTGNITLLGARTPGSTFASAIAVSDTFHYAISHDTLNQWETGIGTMLTSTTFSRSVLTSSNANALVNFAAGTKRVDVVLPSTRIKLYPGPVQIGATTLGSGTLSFQGTGVSFSLSTNSAGGTVHASAGGGGGGIQSIVLNSAISSLRSSFTAFADTAITDTSVVLYSNPLGTVNLQQVNVQFRASGNTLVAAAHIFAFGSDTVDNASVQGIQLLNSNGVTFSLSRVTNAVFGRYGQFTASFDGVRSFSITDAVTSNWTAGTSSTMSGSLLAFERQNAVGTTLMSAVNVGFGFSSNTIKAAAWMFTNALSAQAGTFINSNNVSFGVATTTDVNFGRVIRITASASDVRLGVVSHIGGNAVSSVTQLAFSDASNVTWSLSTAANAATVIASVAAGGGGGITALAMSNSVSSIAATGITYSAANGFSFLLSTGPGNAATLSGSYTVPTLTSLSFSNLNGVTFGTAGSTLTASVLVPVNSGMLNVTDSVSSVNASRLVFSNLNGVTFGIATGASIATLTASVAAAGGLTFSGIDPMPGALLIENQYGQNSLVFHPVTLPNVQFDRVAMPLINGNGASTTAVATWSGTIRLGLYTRNVSTLSLLHSQSFTLNFAVSSSNNSSLYTGLRYTTMPWTTTVNQGQYWYGFVSSTNSAGAALSVRNGMLSQSINSYGGFMGSSNATLQVRLGNGVYTATTASMPASVAFSQINLAATGQASSIAFRPPALFFASGTA